MNGFSTGSAAGVVKRGLPAGRSFSLKRKSGYSFANDLLSILFALRESNPVALAGRDGLSGGRLKGRIGEEMGKGVSGTPGRWNEAWIAWVLSHGGISGKKMDSMVGVQATAMESKESATKISDQRLTVDDTGFLHGKTDFSVQIDESKELFELMIGSDSSERYPHGPDGAGKPETFISASNSQRRRFDAWIDLDSRGREVLNRIMMDHGRPDLESYHHGLKINQLHDHHGHAVHWETGRKESIGERDIDHVMGERIGEHVIRNGKPGGGFVREDHFSRDFKEIRSVHGREGHGSRATGMVEGSEIIPAPGNRPVGADAVRRVKKTSRSLSGRVLSQITEGVIDEVRAVYAEGKEFGQIRIRLFPPDLGEVKIKLELKGKKVKTFFLVENHKVKSIIDSGSARLAEAFNQEGYMLENFSVSVGEHRGGRDMDEDFGERVPGGEPIGIGKEEINSRTRVAMSRKEGIDVLV